MELTPEVIAEYMKTPEGAVELHQILKALEGDSQIGASPDIPGATRGLPTEISGINPVEENRRRMLEQLMSSRGRGLGLGY
jgi:hypothetical protein